MSPYDYSCIISLCFILLSIGILYSRDIQFYRVGILVVWLEIDIIVISFHHVCNVSRMFLLIDVLYIYNTITVLINAISGDHT